MAQRNRNRQGGSTLDYDTQENDELAGESQEELDAMNNTDAGDTEILDLDGDDNTGTDTEPQRFELTGDETDELPPLTGASTDGTTPTGRPPMPLEKRQQISESLKKHWEGKDGPMKGKQHSEETRAKISASLKASRESGELEGLTKEQRQERAKQRRYAYNKARNARLRAEAKAAKEAAAQGAQADPQNSAEDAGESHDATTVNTAEMFSADSEAE